MPLQDRLARLEGGGGGGGERGGSRDEYIALVTFKNRYFTGYPCQAPGVTFVSARTGLPGVSLLWLAEAASFDLQLPFVQMIHPCYTLHTLLGC